MVLLPTFFTFTFSLFQEDHYVASDFLHVLDLMKKEKDKLKQKVEIVTSDFQMIYHDNSSIHTIEIKLFICILTLVTTPNVYFSQGGHDISGDLPQKVQLQTSCETGKKTLCPVLTSNVQFRRKSSDQRVTFQN